MKKRLEAELISIAHRILKLKNKSDVDQLYKETQKLYETLSVLKFYQDNFESVKSDVALAELEEKLESNVVELSPEPSVEIKDDFVEAVAETEPEEEVSEEAIIEEVTEDDDDTEENSNVSEQAEEIEAESIQEETEEEPIIDEKPSFEPFFGLEVEQEELESADQNKSELLEETVSEEKLEDHIGKYVDPVFVKPDEVSLFSSDSQEGERTKQEPLQPLSGIMPKSIAIGLNDRIGFVKHLFNDSNEDFNRVISQLNTFDTFDEAKNFINEMVIPDYNYWVGQEDYLERFMGLIEKKFE